MISKNLCDSVGGGGVVAEIFRDLKNNYVIRWGGGRHFQLMGPFYIFLLSRKGGPWPPGPPPESATGL